jgi:hypothetical protein
MISITPSIWRMTTLQGSIADPRLISFSNGWFQAAADAPRTTEIGAKPSGRIADVLAGIRFSSFWRAKYDCRSLGLWVDVRGCISTERQSEVLCSAQRGETTGARQRGSSSSCADVGAVKPAFEGEGFLREADRLPRLPHVLTDSPPQCPEGAAMQPIDLL